jgi:DNA-binding transcriptional LysR family regulator
MRVTVDEGAAADLADLVRSGAAHLAVGFQDTTELREHPEGLERRELFRERFLVALGPDHPLAGAPAVHLADLAGEEWTAALADGLIVRACRAAGFEPVLGSITSDQLAIRGLVGRGLVVTLVPQLLDQAFAGLALRPIAGPGPTRDVYVLLPPGGRHPLVAPMLDALERGAERLASA